MTGRADSHAIELSGSIGCNTIGIGNGAEKGVGLVEHSLDFVKVALRFMIRTHIQHFLEPILMKVLF